MSLRLRLLVGTALILLGAFAWILRVVETDIRPHYKEVVEDSLVELAQLSAAEISANALGKDGTINKAALAKTFERLRARPIGARIYGILKDRADFEAYVTDAGGRVIFDSEHPEIVGQDYSRWNDVGKTLRGEYGARSTHADPGDKLSSVLHVGAAIREGDHILGAVSLRKPERAVESFLQRTSKKIWMGAGFMVAALLLLIAVFSFYVTRPIGQLAEYARRNRRVDEGGARVPLPKLSTPEFRDLGHAFEEMRVSLEGKRAVESYVQNLTHELKSPLAAIRGAAELLQEGAMPPDDQKRFLSNIEDQAERIRRLIERLLLVASLESRTGLEKTEAFEFSEVIAEILESLSPLIVQKQLRVERDGLPTCSGRGEIFLVEQSLRNLVLNAVEFSPAGATVRISVKRQGDRAVIEICDEGLGIPAFAEDRVFEKFYSLERPDTGKKGSGLGLAFVREVATLHGGTVELCNRIDRSGAVARLTI